mmetsp:Transcript_48034/g.126852  ORF Transcript_48034/g.126852 Transcript_48034/m.126852 type:complete len:213 (-) Transcript_48034:144-782(-)
MGRAHHRLDQDPQLWLLLGYLQENAEQPERPEHGQIHDREDHADDCQDHHDAIEESEWILEIPLETPRRQLDEHLQREDDQKDQLADPLQTLDAEVGRVRLPCHHDDVPHDDHEDHVLEVLVLRDHVGPSNRRAVHAQFLGSDELLVGVHAAPLAKAASILVLFLLLLLFVVVLLVEGVQRLIHHGQRHVEQQEGGHDDQHDEVTPGQRSAI